jgi:hypothetical protein
MSFSGASRVIHARVDGSDVNDGLSWNTAVKSIQGALGKLTSPPGHGLILIAPGRYLNTSVVVSAPNTRFQGAGPGTVLEPSAAVNYCLKLQSSNVEAADLVIEAGDVHAIARGGSGVIENVRIMRCTLRGDSTLALTKCKSIMLQECRV